MNRHHNRILLVAIVLLCVVPAVAHAQGRTKVHKNRIRLAPPDDEGLVTITGYAGAIENPLGVMLTVKNLSTDALIAGEVAEDGSFVVGVAAQADNQLRVIARKTGINTSYGTFNVPSDTVAPPPDPVGIATQSTTAYIPPRLGGSAPATPGTAAPYRVEPAGPTRLAVVMMVVDTETGAVLAHDHVIGLTKQAAESSIEVKSLAQRILQRCLTLAQADLLLPPRRVTSTPTPREEKPQD